MSMPNGSPQAQSQGELWVNVCRGVYHGIFQCLSLSLPLKGVNKILLQSLIMPNTLIGVCTSCSCPKGYPKPSPRGRYKPKSGGMFTVEFYQVDKKAAPIKE